MLPLSGSLKRRIERALADVDAPHGGASASSSSQPPRGNLRRRLERASGSGIDERDMPFTQKLKVAWASGRLSSAKIQENAQAAEQQGASKIEALSSAGTGGA